MKKIYRRSLSATSLGVLLVQLIYRITPHHATQKALDKIKPIAPLDAIIVPGVPFENNKWDTVMQARVLWSVILFQNGFARNIIYSGGAVYTPYIEAVIMGLYAEKLGIPRENIHCETQARHSTENVYYSYLLAKKKGFKTIGLATDIFQSAMLKPFTKRRFATLVHHLPFSQDSVATILEIDPTIDPSSAIAPDFISITQQDSFTKRIRGTLGGNIDFSPYKNRKLPLL